ncbi:MAG: hypothetical protein M3O46_16910, partial [Myxococcota bacterium]|nr:hypothetical protein [Myxococcota bacterium]
MNKTSVTRRIPFSPVVSMRTVWLVVVSWAPLVGLVASLLGAQGRLATLRFWDGAPILLLTRLALGYGVANKAVASRTRWRAVAW